VAELLVAQGAGVVVNGRDPDAAAEAAQGNFRRGGTPRLARGSCRRRRVDRNVLREFGSCPGTKTRLSTGPDYEAHIVGLNRRGVLDEVSTRAALDAPPAEYVAPTYSYLASDLAKDVTGQIFIAAGGFVGRFDRPWPSLLGYRDHHDSPPWSVDQIHAMLTR
jgi:NAD(P)-dependent dehydrogenase (short-subunit alcohol dehydrogenase family)